MGQILAKAGAVALGVYPLVQPMLGSGKAAQVTGTVVNDLTQIAGLAGMIEIAMQGKTGADKMAALLPLARNVIATSELVSGKKVAHPELLEKAAQEIAQGVVDILNSLHEDAATA